MWEGTNDTPVLTNENQPISFHEALEDGSTSLEATLQLFKQHTDQLKEVEVQNGSFDITPIAVNLLEKFLKSPNLKFEMDTINNPGDLRLAGMPDFLKVYIDKGISDYSKWPVDENWWQMWRLMNRYLEKAEHLASLSMDDEIHTQIRVN
jgi:hypothetical protein